MDDSRIYPIPVGEEAPDKNGLNSDSVKFAKYYYCIFVLFILQHSVNNSINEDSIRLWVMTSKIPLLKEMFSIYKKNPIEWNDFFQLIVFCCLCPMVSFFNFALHLIPEYNGKVDMLIIKKFFSLAGNDTDSEGLKELFRRFDINRDGSITYNQFLSILSHRYNSCKNFYTFRINLINYFFPEERYKIILNRRRNIKHIKDYKFNNHDKYVSQPCTVSLHQFLNGDSHPDRFDYDCEIEEISFNSLTNMIISKYHTYYKNKKGGNLHHLEMFKENIITYEIDQFYIEYNKIISNMLKVKLPSQYKTYASSSVCSSLDLSYNGGNNTHRNSSSILRCSTYSTQNRASTTAINITVTPINFGQFKNLKKSIHKDEIDSSNNDGVDVKV